MPLRSAAEPPLRLSLVIPTYNEAKNLEALVEELCRLFDPVLGQDYELIVVDDASPDGTYALARGLAERYPRLRALLRSDERGLGSAVIHGWQAARGEFLAVMDGDLQHPPEINLKLLEELERGADLVVASRNVAGGGVSDWSLARRVLSRGAQLLGLFVLPEVLSRVADPMSGYFMVRRAAIADRPLRPLGYKVLIEVLARGSISGTREVGYVFREREADESKVRPRVYFDYVWHLLGLRLERFALSAGVCRRCRPRAANRTRRA